MRELVAPSMPGPVTAPVSGSPVTAPSSPAPVSAPARQGALTLPDGLVPKVPRERIAWAVGVGTASAVARGVGVVTAHADGSGMASAVSSAVARVQAAAGMDGQASWGAVVDADASVVGAASAGVVGVHPVVASATAATGATVSAYAAFERIAQTIGFGKATTRVIEVEYGKGQAKAAMGASASSSAVARVKAGASAVGMASASAYAVTFQSGGITKVGVQRIGRNVWETITGWTVRSGYPGTVIESNGVRVPAGAYTISAQVQCSGSYVDMGLRIMLDGAPIPGAQVNARGDTGRIGGTATVTLSEGLVTLQALIDTSIGSWRDIQPTDTWLTIERA